MSKFIYFSLIVFLSFGAFANITLIGNDAPHGNVNDGNFDLIPGWMVHDSPHWRINKKLGKGANKAGIAKGVFTTRGNDKTVVESNPLTNIKAYQKPIAGDVLQWRFVAKAEHKAQAFISMAFVFPEQHLEQEKQVITKQILSGGPEEDSVITGEYVFTKQDEAAGMPFVRFTLDSENHISIHLKSVDIHVMNLATAGPNKFDAKTENNTIILQWEKRPERTYNLYRRSEKNKQFHKIENQLTKNSYIDNAIISGVEYDYLVTQVIAGEESSASILNQLTVHDKQAPKLVTQFLTQPSDTDVRLSWQTPDNDIEYFVVYRGDENGKNLSVINPYVRSMFFIDDLPHKGKLNSYAIQAVDYSGNKSKISPVSYALVNAVFGASFSDLIQPIPIHRALSSNLWGAESVLPRDPDNGIEHPDWSYWGGDPTLGKDGKYHMLVVRWPENGPRGHWEWPDSTVVHAVSEKPTGPYIPTNDIAYDYAQGKGHNADVLELNDGRFLLYSLINWKPTLLTAEKMKGPWQVEGEMQVEYDAAKLQDKREYQVERNLSGVQLENGDMLFVSKFGRMIKSTQGLLGPYKVLTGTINENETIPERYRRSNYEDPVMWKDDIQFHMIINAFLDYRAIYLRSPDGIRWFYDTGLAYTPNNVEYEDGTKPKWYKLERPHVIQDTFGRATHLSLAVIDTIKRQDFSNDKHSSKNIILPLTKHKRASVLNNEKIHTKTPKIEVLIKSELGFDARKDINFSSVLFGASQAVNFGRGAKILEYKVIGEDVLLTFSGKNTEFTQTNFAGKLLGRLNNGALFIAFTSLKNIE